MYLFVNVIDKEFYENSDWDYINDVFQSQSPEWRPGKKLFGIKSRGNKEYLAFILTVALIYRKFIQDTVLKRRWEKTWIPLSQKYLKWKQDHGRYENIWMNTGTLINSIEIKYEKWNSRVRIGINPRQYYEIETAKGKRRIQVLLVAKWMEYGTEKMPARPLFRPAREYIGKHISRYYKQFQELVP